MPVRFRKNFLADAPTAAAATDPVVPVPDGSLGAVLAAVPVPLALLHRGRVVAENSACRALLRAELGDSDFANRRWLAAAATRLQARSVASEVLPGRGDARALEVHLGPVGTVPDEHLVAVRVAPEDRSGDDDLVATVSTLSHELRTPLASMKSSLGLVLAGDAGPVAPDQERFLGMTMRNIDRLERLVSDLLDTARSERGRTALQKQDLDLAAVLTEAVELQAAAAATAGVALAGEITGPLTIEADPDRLTQIVANVLGNALKFTSRGGRVVVSATPDAAVDPLVTALAAPLDLRPRYCGISVADTGCGMEPAEVDRIFEPWFRGRGAGSSGAAGSGLGLHITRDLVAGHGGWINLQSTPDEGTTVRIGLPRDPASEALLRAAREIRAQMGPGEEIVLLDGRPGGAASGVVADFLVWRGQGGKWRPAEPVAGAVALAVPDATDWQSTWEIYGREEPAAKALGNWRQVVVPEPETIKSQLPAS